jgi:hypothetical protein
LFLEVKDAGHVSIRLTRHLPTALGPSQSS